MMARIQSGRAHFWAIFQVAIQPPYLRTLRVEPPFLSILISTGSFSPRDFFTYTLASFHSMVARESLPGIVAVNDMRSPLKPGGSSMFARLRSTALSFQCSESIVVYSSSSILKCYTNHCKLSCNLLPLPTLSNVFALLGRGFLCCCCCSWLLAFWPSARLPLLPYPSRLRRRFFCFLCWPCWFPLSSFFLQLLLLWLRQQPELMHAGMYVSSPCRCSIHHVY